ncbi:MAG: serine/threonine-protein kinase [Acidobacteriota bacterium]
MSSTPGSFDGKYEVLGKIREGGMGAIYMVRHRLLDEIRIIKVMRPEVAESADQRKRFLREAQMATRLKHGNIVGFYDFFVDDEGTAFMVMEFIDGINLRDMIRNCGPLPIPLALHLAGQSLSALDYLHRKGIVHRDISPDNVMMMQEEDGTLQAKLIDLGIAKLARAEEQEQLTAADEFIGKLRYSSPEQLTKKASSSGIDGRSDLFSFAVVLYEALTGVCPYGGGSLQDILMARLQKPPMPFSKSDPGGKIAPALREILLRALQKNPDDRWQSAQEFAKALETLPASDVGARHAEEVSEYVKTAIEFVRAAAAAQNPAGASLQKSLQSKFRVSEVSIRPLEATDIKVQKTLSGWSDATPSGSGDASGVAKTIVTEPRNFEREPRRSSIAGYAAVAVGAAVLVVLGIVVSGWMNRDRRASQSQSQSQSGSGSEAAARVPAPAPTAVVIAAVPAPVLPTAVPAGVSAAAPAPVAAAPLVQDAPAPVPAPAGRPAERRAEAPRDRRPAPDPPRVSRPAGGSVAADSNLNRSKIHFCAEIGRTAFAQGATQEVPAGFSGTALKPARPDSGRISIQIRMNPEEAVEGQDFTVTARFINGGDETFRLSRAEESSPAKRGGFEAISGLSVPQAVDIGSSIEIYRTTKSLAAGSTFRKAFRVQEQRRGDNWENSITVKPCVEQ